MGSIRPQFKEGAEPGLEQTPVLELRVGKAGKVDSTYSRVHREHTLCRAG